MVYREFDGRCFFDLITNDRFVIEFHFRFCVYIETLLDFIIQKPELARSKKIIS